MFMQSTDIPSVAGYYSERAALANNDIRKLGLTHDTRERYEVLISRYGDLLTREEQDRAFSLTLGWKITQRYDWDFLCNVLMQAYRVFDKSYTKYEPMLSRVRQYNPEWERALMADHERKMRVCKVPIYIGTQ